MRNTAVSKNRRRSLRWYAVLTSTATLTAVAAALAVGGPPAQATVGHRPGAITPDAIPAYKSLKSVSADSPTNVWAVSTYTNGSGVPEPLLLHWNGTTWSWLTSSLPSGAQYPSLTGASAVSANDVWAVGHYENSSGVQVPLILNCTSTACTQVTSPSPSSGQGYFLTGVSAASATGAWAVGESQNSSGATASLILNCTSTSCKQVKSSLPTGGTNGSLAGVSADSATDAWAVGQYTNSSAVQEPLILHWTGTAWKKVKSPAPSGAQFSGLAGVSAVSATDAWAVGRYANSSGVTVPWILNCNGTACKKAKSQAPKSAFLAGVSADSATDAWAAGYYENSSGVDVPLILHWTGTGTAWKKVKSGAPSGAQGYLNAVSADSVTDAWAVGYYFNSSTVQEALILHWTGKTWKKVTSASANGA